LQFLYLFFYPVLFFYENETHDVDQNFNILKFRHCMTFLHFFNNLWAEPIREEFYCTFFLFFFSLSILVFFCIQVFKEDDHFISKVVDGIEFLSCCDRSFS
jgi:hypothetical protein